MKIVIGTPTYNYQVTAPFVSSLLGLMSRLSGRAEVSWLSIQATLINVARNHIATLVLHDPTATHLLFVDSDVSFRPEAVEKMLALKQPVSATVYPKRQLDFDKVIMAAKRGATTAKAKAAGLEYPFAATNPSERRGGFITARIAPAGLMLIQRKALERIRDQRPDLYADTAGSIYDLLGLQKVLLCFEPIQSAHGVAGGEDVGFCHLWRSIGGEIWAQTDEVTGHTGAYTYEGRPA
jgi:hypothetical protein